MQARVAYHDSALARLRSALEGGVYVPVSALVSPNPFLARVPERDVRTPSGRVLTLMNMAHVLADTADTRVRSHITSLNPLGRRNTPDAWEAQALQRLAAGAPEVSEVQTFNGEGVLRLMRPLTADERCVSCHGERGSGLGGLPGGISVSVPMAPLWATARKPARTLVVAHAGLRVLGFAGMAVSARRLATRVTERESAWRAQRDSEERYRTLVENLDLAITLLDRNSRVVMANGLAKRWMGENSTRVGAVTTPGRPGQGGARRAA